MPFVSTADVPPKFLKSAFLVGCIPFRSLRSDPRISYTLYVPPHHYNPDPSKRSSNDSIYRRPLLPLVVKVHGTGRNAEFCRNSLIAFADDVGCAVLAPLFPMGADGSASALHNYKLLRHPTLDAGTAIIDMLNEISQIWPGIAADKVFMTGFSGGGQFTHRWLLLYPNRLEAVSIGAPGRPTSLNLALDWPAGIRNALTLFGGSRIDVDKISQVKIQIAVGETDTEPHGGAEFWDWIRLMKTKGGDDVRSRDDGLGEVKNRVDTCHQIKAEMEAHGVRVELSIVPDAAHVSEKTLSAVIEFFQPLIEHARKSIV